MRYTKMQHEDLLNIQECHHTITASKPMTLLVIGWTRGESPLLQAMPECDFTLHYAPSMRDALLALQQGYNSDAILLNGAAGFDIYTATAVLRLYSSLPIVLIFACVDSLNPMRAVDAGADEWQLASVDPRELTARILARIRRYRIIQRRSAALEHYAGFFLNPRTSELITPNRTIRLSPAEMHILRRLAASPDCPVPVDELTSSLERIAAEQTRSLPLVSIIQQLRSKLADTPADLQSIDDNAFLLHS